MSSSTFIWIILFILTSITLFLGGLEAFSFTFILIVLFTTFIKGQLVIDYFMGLKNVELKYRAIVSIWLFVVISLIAIAYAYPA